MMFGRRRFVALRSRASGRKVGRAARVGRKTPPGFRPGPGKGDKYRREKLGTLFLNNEATVE